MYGLKGQKLMFHIMKDETKVFNLSICYKGLLSNSHL